jgi:hypothetical protein
LQQFEKHNITDFEFIEKYDKDLLNNVDKILFEENPFKNIRLPLVLYTEDGCETCKCNSGGVDLDTTIADQIAAFAEELEQQNISPLFLHMEKI